MAKLNNKILGKVSGSLGDITFRQKKGINYLASRPAVFTTPKDINSVTRRKRFSISVKLASLLNSIPEIRLIWRDQISAGSTLFNFLVKTNYINLEGDSIGANTLITPVTGFTANFETKTLLPNGLNLVMQPISSNSGIDLNVEKKIKLISVLILSQSSIASLNDPFLLNINSEPVNLVLDVNITFSIQFSSQATEIYNKYNNHNLLFAVVTLDDNNNPVNYSVTNFL